MRWTAQGDLTEEGAEEDEAALAVHAGWSFDAHKLARNAPTAS